MQFARSLQIIRLLVLLNWFGIAPVVFLRSNEFTILEMSLLLAKLKSNNTVVLIF